MDSVFLSAVVDHLRALVAGGSVGRVWQPSATCLVLDVRSTDGRFLYISCDPTDPALFLTSRSIASVEPEGSSERSFAALMRKRLRGARLERVGRHPSDRVVGFEFGSYGASGERERWLLIAALTGRSANAYLVDPDGAVAGTLRPVPDGGLPDIELPSDAWNLAEGPADAEFRLYSLPTDHTAKLILAPCRTEPPSGTPFERFADPSSAADERARRVEAMRVVSVARQRVRQRARGALDRVKRRRDAILADLAAAEGHDRDRMLGESLLAQLSTARRVPGGLAFVDLYSDDQHEVRVPCDDAESPQRIAERLFARQRKARRTREEATTRLVDTDAAADRLAGLVARIDAAATLADMSEIDRALDRELGVRRVSASGSRTGVAAAQVRGARRFVSSDGYEILVGRSSAANDALTFKTARPSDLWLHAADYPGSHVIVRLPVKSEVPYRTLREAAQLAAFYSEARGNALVDVRYTERRHVTKPRGAAQGLVRVSRFKTIAVAPAADLDRSAGG